MYLALWIGKDTGDGKDQCNVLLKTGKKGKQGRCFLLIYFVAEIVFPFHFVITKQGRKTVSIRYSHVCICWLILPHLTSLNTPHQM